MPEETGTCTAQVCPAPTGIPGWKSPIFYEYMRDRLLKREMILSTSSAFRLSEAKTGLFDHDPREIS
jgi:hypothetical protein